MSFIGPNPLNHIGECLREEIPLQRNTMFSGCSIIIVGDLSPLSSIKGITLYVGTSHGSELWNTFNIAIILDTIFHQQGDKIA